MNINECPNCQAEIKAGTQVCPHCGYAFPFATDMLDAGRVLQKRYELVNLIHSGGMGYIYLAQDKRLDREVVVKQIRQPVKSDAHRKKLEEEALRMAQLLHPAVAMVFDHFVEDEFYFLVVEYIKGQTLNEIFEKSGRSLEESQVINWMAQVCEVIGYLHNKGMVHRDISPDNIMLTEEGHIKLIDFGTLHDLSLLAGKKAGKEGKFGFTPKEQWAGNPVPQSDVFAIGATAYYLLIGYLPLSEAIRRGETAMPEDFVPVFPTIKKERPDISDTTEAVLGKALSPVYVDRFLNATALGSALRNLVSSGKKEVHANANDRVEVTVGKATGNSVKVLRRQPRWLLPVILCAGLLLLVSIIITFGEINPLKDTKNNITSKLSSTSNDPPSYFFTWGTWGKGDGQFTWPEGIAIDSAGDVYVVDSNSHRIQKFDKNGRFILKWGSEGKKQGQFNYPIDIAVDNSDNVYVVECFNHRVQKFDSKGRFLTTWGSEGRGDGQFRGPSGIAVDNQGIIYVADTLNGRIQKFDGNGRFIAKWGDRINADTGEVFSPQYIAIDSANNVYITNNIYISNDYYSNYVEKFDGNGRFLAKWGSTGIGDGQFDQPEFIATDKQDNIYVADVKNCRIQKFDSNGKFLTKWGSWGEGDKRFSHPADICVDGLGNIYIADYDLIVVFRYSSAK